jgi:hypothetical protein
LNYEQRKILDAVVQIIQEVCLEEVEPDCPWKIVDDE